MPQIVEVEVVDVGSRQRLQPRLLGKFNLSNAGLNSQRRRLRACLWQGGETLKSSGKDPLIHARHHATRVLLRQV